jgi:WD40 repeat protein
VVGRDGASYVTSGYDRSIRVWDTCSGNLKGLVRQRSLGWVLSLVQGLGNVAAPSLVVGCGSGEVVQYDLCNGFLIQRYKGHCDVVNTVTVIRSCS